MAIGSAGTRTPGAVGDGGEGRRREADHGGDVYGIGVGRRRQRPLAALADASGARTRQPGSIEREGKIRARDGGRRMGERVEVVGRQRNPCGQSQQDVSKYGHLFVIKPTKMRINI